MDGGPAGRDDLGRRARAGDPDAWRAVYLDAHPALLGYAARRLGDLEAARDAVSETMARALADTGAFDPDRGSPRAWLFGICRNVVLGHQRRRRTGELPDDDLLVEPGAGPDDAAVLDEERAEVRAAFRLLSPDDQELLLLRVVGGLSADECSAVLGRRPGAVRMAQSRALGRLRGHLEALQAPGGGVTRG